MNSDSRLLCSVCNVATSKRGKCMHTTSGKITSKFHVTSCMRKFDKPSRMNSLILGVFVSCTKIASNYVYPEYRYIRCCSYWVFNYYNNNCTSRSNDSNFRGPDFNSRPKTQAIVIHGSGLPGRDNVVRRLIAVLFKGRGDFIVKGQAVWSRIATTHTGTQIRIPEGWIVINAGVKISESRNIQHSTTRRDATAFFYTLATSLLNTTCNAASSDL